MQSAVNPPAFAPLSPLPDLPPLASQIAALIEQVRVERQEPVTSGVDLKIDETKSLIRENAATAPTDAAFSRAVDQADNMVSVSGANTMYQARVLDAADRFRNAIVDPTAVRLAERSRWQPPAAPLTPLLSVPRSSEDILAEIERHRAAGEELQAQAVQLANEGKTYEATAVTEQSVAAFTAAVVTARQGAEDFPTQAKRFLDAEVTWAARRAALVNRLSQGAVRRAKAAS